MSNKLTLNMVDAIKVQFLKSIFEDDFPEKGMTAWLTDIEWDKKHECYQLWFDFTEFEASNLKYFKETYYPNKHTKLLECSTSKSLFTALEAGQYSAKYSVYFGSSEIRDDDRFESEIKEYLRVVDAQEQDSPVVENPISTSFEAGQNNEHIPIQLLDAILEYFSIAVYLTSETDFADTAEPRDLHTWFVSTLVGETRFNTNVIIYNQPTADLAKLAALEAFNLLDVLKTQAHNTFRDQYGELLDLT